MNLLDLVFPPRCGGCGQPGGSWCQRCRAAVELLPVATINGIPLVAGGRLSGSLQRAIHAYKYRRRPRLAQDLATSLTQAIHRAQLLIDALTFVPLHDARQCERGFNQAEQLARALSRRLELPVMAGLRRVRPTRAQVGLRQDERRINLLGAFQWTGPVPERLALVDDVCTTGATLEACAAAIREAGGSLAAFLVLARAQTLPAPSVTSPEQSACL